MGVAWVWHGCGMGVAYHIKSHAVKVYFCHRHGVNDYARGYDIVHASFIGPSLYSHSPTHTHTHTHTHTQDFKENLLPYKPRPVLSPTLFEQPKDMTDLLPATKKLKAGEKAAVALLMLQSLTEMPPQA